MNTIIKIVIGLVLCIQQVSSFASSLGVGISLGTYHVKPAYVGDNGETYKYNNFNPGLYLYGDNFTVGTYRNSYERTSVYAVYVAKNFIGPVDFSAGLVTGYFSEKVLPMVLISTKIGKMRVSFFPPQPKGSAGVHFSYEH